MSDPSNLFKSLADSLLSGTEPETKQHRHNVQQPSAALSLGERIEAFFSAELLHTTRGARIVGSLEDAQTNEFHLYGRKRRPRPTHTHCRDGQQAGARQSTIPVLCSLFSQKR